MADEQRKARIMYGGEKYVVPASEAEKVTSAMMSPAMVSVVLAMNATQTLTIVVGGGIPVAVLDPSELPSYVY